MKYNDSDMDDLFRRASERYPLRTDSADWDRLVNALDNGPTAPSDGEERRKRRFVFLWLLLIPLAGVGYLTWQTKSAYSAHQADVVAAKPGKPSEAKVSEPLAKDTTEGGQGTKSSRSSGAAVSGDVKTVDAGTGNGGKAVAGKAVAGNAVAGGKTAAAGGDGKAVTGAGAKGGAGTGSAGTEGAVAGSSALRNGVSGGEPDVTGAGGRRNSGRNISGKSKRATNSRVGPGLDVAAGQTGRNGGAAVSGAGVAGSAGLTSGSGRKESVVSGVGRNGNAAVTGRPGKNGSGTAKGDVQEDDALMPALLDLRTVPVAGGFNVAVDVSSPYRPVEPPKPAERIPTKRNSHGYIGLLGAPDFSTVRFQSMKGVGTTFGVLLGYSFNDRLAIESGVYLDRKRYYTDGEYFNTKNVHVPTGYTLLNVDGTCNMWEIPVNVRYNFSTSPRMKWFGTAGLSTYFMTNEKYTYAYDYNWTGPTDYSHWNIKKPSQYWFSILNLSAGFEQRIGKIGNLRLEPYVRVPLSGIGTGRLSIMSAGLNIGFTHQLW